MFETVFLGHQGWLIGTASTKVLLDPILTPEFSAVAGAGMKVFPPRRFDPAAAPALDAVIISHEHDDHFHLPSLNLISREVPLYLPANASWAMHRAAAAMGFQVRAMAGGETFTVGDLEVTAYSPDFRDVTTDEWDVMNFFFRDLQGHGSMFTNVDVPIAEPIMNALAKSSPKIRTYTNNFLDLGMFTNWLPRQGAEALLPDVVSLLQAQAARWGRPEVVLTCGGGWSHTGDLDWMNQACFPVDNERLAEALRVLGASPDLPVVGAVPGTRVELAYGKLKSVEEGVPWLRPAPRQEWPDRTFARSFPRRDRITPLSSDTSELSEVEERLLVERVEELGRRMAGSDLFLTLLSLTPEEAGRYARKFVLVLQTSAAGDGWVFEYSPASCGFVSATQEVDQYIGGAAMWARDFLDLMAGETTPGAVTFGHLLEWRFGEVMGKWPSFSFILWQELHPLSQPELREHFYRRQIAALAPAEPMFRGADGAQAWAASV